MAGVAETSAMERNLQGWKSIAGYFGRDERTVMRWAAQRGLPIRRLPGAQRSSVYAIPHELAAWLAGEHARGGEPSTIPAAKPSFEPQPDSVPTPIAADADPAAASQFFQPPVNANDWAKWVGVAAAVLLVLAALTFARPGSGVRAQAVPADPESTRFYQRASYDLANRTPASLRRAVSEFGSAIAADPRNAVAYAGLGEAYLLLPEYSTVDGRESYHRAEAAAEAAIALAPDIAAAHRVRAFVAFWLNGDVATARAEFARALAIAPDDPVTHHWYATALSANGEQASAVAEIRRALALDPQSSSIMADAGLLLYLGGERREGLDMLRHVEQSRPDQISSYRYQADIALAEGDDRTFLAEAHKEAQLRDDGEADAMLDKAARAYAAGGRQAMLATLDRALSARSADTRAHWYELARITALEGQADRTARLLERAAAQHDPRFFALAGDTCFRNLLPMPQIQRIRRHTPLAS